MPADLPMTFAIPCSREAPRRLRDVRSWRPRWWIVALGAALASSARSAPARADGPPGCSDVGPKQCVARALDAMGGAAQLEAIHRVALDVIGHTLLMEQSYRQAPFITAYQRDKIVLDLAGGRVRDDQHTVWPEADPHEAESDVSLIVTPRGGGVHQAAGDHPCGRSSLEAAREVLALGPLRVLLAASAARDLRYAPAESLRSTPHAVVAFTWNAVSVRVLLNAYNHLPDAVDTTQQLHDFWYFWGDVQQRVYWDNWKLLGSVRYPTNEIVERNGAIWKSSQALDVELEPVLDERRFALDPAVAQQSAQGTGWSRPFAAGKPVVLAPDVLLYPGAWNATIVKQRDGVVILEAPISGTYTRGLLDEARARYPGVPITAVVSTSDSWPHVGGVREAVAQRLPIYLLDLNRPLLERLIAAPHTIDPDALQTAPQPPSWHLVSGKVELGTGANRVWLIPLRGAATERQYMVYFPAHRLLYASDTLVIDPDKHRLYAPELLHEVQQAVEREHLQVDTVFAMHQEPIAWSAALALLRAQR